MSKTYTEKQYHDLYWKAEELREQVGNMHRVIADLQHAVKLASTAHSRGADKAHIAEYQINDALRLLNKLQKTCTK